MSVGAGDGRGGARSAARPNPPAGSCALLSCPGFGQGVCRQWRAGREREARPGLTGGGSVPIRAGRGLT